MTASRAAALRHALQAKRQPDIVEDGRPRHQRRLLEDEADLVLRGGRCGSRRRGQSIVPEVGSPRPAMMRSAVDLPQPDGPSRLTNSPLADVERHVLQRERAVREGLRDRRGARPAASRGSPRAASAPADAVDRLQRHRRHGRPRVLSAKRRASRPGRARRSRRQGLLLQLHADALADELGRVGLREIEVGLDHLRLRPSCRRSPSRRVGRSSRCRLLGASPESTMPYSFICSIEKAICSSVMSGLSFLISSLAALLSP